MTAAATNADTPRYGVEAVVRKLMELPVAASTHIYQGTIVCLNLSGYLVPASADPSLTVVGVAQEEADNSAGAAGALECPVERGAFYLTNSSSTAAVSEADIDRIVYAADDLTVSRTNVAGTYPACGKVIGFEGSKPIVEAGLLSRSEAGGAVHDVLYPAGADLSTTGQNLFVKLNGSSQIVLADTAGEAALGVLLNAPASAAIGIVRVFGPCRVMAGATIADGAIVATTATTARAKAAVASTVNTSDGGSSTDPVVGSYAMGMALGDGASGSLMSIFVNPMGAIPTTAA
jgi:hypothetical protein